MSATTFTLTFTFTMISYVTFFLFISNLPPLTGISLPHIRVVSGASSLRRRTCKRILPTPQIPNRLRLRAPP